MYTSHIHCTSLIQFRNTAQPCPQIERQRSHDTWVYIFPCHISDSMCNVSSSECCTTSFMVREQLAIVSPLSRMGSVTAFTSCPDVSSSGRASCWVICCFSRLFDFLRLLLRNGQWNWTSNLNMRKVVMIYCLSSRDFTLNWETQCISYCGTSLNTINK